MRDTTPVANKRQSVKDDFIKDKKLTENDKGKTTPRPNVKPRNSNLENFK